MNIFEQCRYAKEQENWGNPAKMSGVIIWLRDRIEGMSGKKINVHCGYEMDGHAPKSFHKSGLAFDFHLEGLATRKTIFKAYKLVESILESLQVADYVGLGVYLDWYEGTLGFHIDFRGEKCRWIRKGSVYDYKFDEDKLK